MRVRNYSLIAFKILGFNIYQLHKSITNLIILHKKFHVFLAHFVIVTFYLNYLNM